MLGDRRVFVRMSEGGAMLRLGEGIVVAGNGLGYKSHIYNEATSTFGIKLAVTSRKEKSLRI